jgi:multidrug efflux system membrane fusion protein
VPAQAVQTGQDGQYVFVVTPQSTVEQRPIGPLSASDQDIVVDKGLKSGETVVTEGQLRLEPGSRVTTDPNAAGGGGRGRAAGRRTWTLNAFRFRFRISDCLHEVRLID